MNLKLNKLNINQSALEDIIMVKSNIIQRDLVEDLQQTAPIDDTDKQKVKDWKAKGKNAWLMDRSASRLLWKAQPVVKSSFKGGVRAMVTNRSFASIALALGFHSPLNLNAEKVERSPENFSEQSPKGTYIAESMVRAFGKNGIKYINTRTNH